MSKLETLKTLNVRIEKDSKNPNLYSSRAKYFFDLEEYEKAIDDLLKAISLLVDGDLERMAFFLTNKGECHLKMGETTSGIKDLTSCIELRNRIPDSSLHRTYNLRGEAFLEIKNHILASKDFTEAIKIVRELKREGFISQERERHHNIIIGSYYFNRGKARSFYLEDKSLIDFENAILFFNEEQSRILECHKQRCRTHEKLKKPTKEYLKDLNYVISHSSELNFLVQRAKLFFDMHEIKEMESQKESEISTYNRRILSVSEMESSLKDIKRLFSKSNRRKLSISDRRDLSYIRAKIFKEKKKFHKSLRDIKYVIKKSTESSKNKRIEYHDFKATLHVLIDDKESAISEYNTCINILTKERKPNLRKRMNINKKNWKERCHEFKTKIGDIYKSEAKYSLAETEHSYFFDRTKPSELYGEKVSIFAESLFKFGISLKERSGKRKDTGDSFLFTFDDSLPEEHDSEECGEQCEKVLMKLIEKSNGLNIQYYYYFELGDFHMKFSYLEKAIQDYSIIIEGKPDFNEGISFVLRGNCYEMVQKYEEMAEDFRTFVSFTNQYIGDNIKDKNRINALITLQNYSRRKNDKYLKYYYYHLRKNTLARKLNDMNDVKMKIPESFFNRKLEGGGISIQKESEIVEKKFYQVGLFMSHTALFKLNNPKMLFEIAIYCMIVKKKEMRTLSYDTFFGMEEVTEFERLVGTYFFNEENKNTLERFLFLINNNNLYSNIREDMVDEEEEEGEEEEEEEEEEEGDSTVMKVIWKSSDQNIFIKKYFLSDLFLNQQEENTFELSKEVPEIDPLIINKFLFGIDLTDKELTDNMFGLFFFFRDLQLKYHVFALCCSISSLSLKTKMLLFTESISKFEKDTRRRNLQRGLRNENENEEKEEEEFDILKKMNEEKDKKDKKVVKRVFFNSPISLALFKELKNHLADIKKDKTYIQVLDHLGYYFKLKNGNSIILEDHKFFKMSEFLDSSSCNGYMVYCSIFSFGGYSLSDSASRFQEFFNSILVDVFKSKKFTSLILTTKDGGVFPVHKEILILRSNFFYQMFKFPGRESNSKNVQIDDLSSYSLEIILKCVYDFNIIEECIGNVDNIRILFELLIHSEMYDNMYMKMRIIEAIDKKFKGFAEKDLFVLKLLENGNYIGKFPEWYLNLFRKRCESLTKMSSNVIEAIIKNSIERDNLVNENEELKLKMKVVKRKKCSSSEKQESFHQPIAKRRKK